MTKYLKALTIALLLFDSQTTASTTELGADIIQNEMLRQLMDQIKQNHVENQQMVQLNTNLKEAAHQHQEGLQKDATVQVQAQAEQEENKELTDQALMYQLAANSDALLTAEESSEKHHKHGAQKST